MRVKSVIFDMDGTLLNTVEFIANIHNAVFKEHNLPTRTLKEYKSFVGDGMKMLLKRALPQNSGEELLSFLIDEILKRYNEMGVETIKPFDGIVEMLAELVKRGIKISILTNKEHEYAVLNAEGTALKEYRFDVIIGDRKGKPLKPDPSGLFEIAEITKIPLNETIYVGDMKADILTGKNGGVFTVGCLWGSGKKEDLVDCGADLIVSRPLEIVDFVDRSND